MAIKIIVRGKAPSEKVWKGTCSSCKSVLEWKEADATYKQNATQRDPDPFTQIPCPVCGKTVSGY